jgi:hypothetical protein
MIPGPIGEAAFRVHCFATRQDAPSRAHLRLLRRFDTETIFFVTSFTIMGFCFLRVCGRCGAQAMLVLVTYRFHGPESSVPKIGRLAADRVVLQSNRYVSGSPGRNDASASWQGGCTNGAQSRGGAAAAVSLHTRKGRSQA